MNGQGDVTIKIVNEDNGKDVSIKGGQGTAISTFIDKMYEVLKQKFGVQRQQDDRVRCESSGEDVLQFAGLHIKDYLAAGHCSDLVWLFAGGTGGAGC